jgi:Domain of unknown function (DUF1707)
VTGPGDAEPVNGTQPPDPLVGTPERDSAQEALEEHLVAKRLDPSEYERRTEAAKLARTRSELLQLFADLPIPHPALPPTTPPPPGPEEDTPPPIFVAGCLTLALGLPVAVVLGFAYGVWWTLAVPVVVTVVMAYAEHLRIARMQRRDSGPCSPED